MKRRIISGGILTVVLLAVILFCITESRPSDSTHLPLMATVVSETGKVIKVSIAEVGTTKRSVVEIGKIEGGVSKIGTIKTGTAK